MTDEHEESTRQERHISMHLVDLLIDSEVEIERELYLYMSAIEGPNFGPVASTCGM